MEVRTKTVYGWRRGLQLTDQGHVDDEGRATFPVAERVIPHVGHVDVLHLDIGIGHLDASQVFGVVVPHGFTLFHQCEVIILAGETQRDVAPGDAVVGDGQGLARHTVDDGVFSFRRNRETQDN